MIYDSFTGKNGMQINIRAVGAEYISDMLSLEACSINPETFAVITEAELMESAEKDILLAAFVGERLIAFNILLKNRPSERNLSVDLGLSPEEVATFDGVIVDPAFRGNGLQRRFLAIDTELARALGASHLAATVAEANAPSRRNFSAAGFTELGTIPKYGSERILISKSLQGESTHNE